MTAPVRLVVTAAVIARGDTFLVTRRPRGAHLAGFWEFPGGKCEAGEPLDACLRREIREELDCAAIVHDEIYSVIHAYDERIVELHFFWCTLEGAPRPALGQEMQWVGRGDLRSLSFPPADAELIALLEQGLAATPRSPQAP
jgi:mutator protein MutT